MGGDVDNALRNVGAQAKELFGVELGGEALRQMGDFAAELLKWNRIYNLTSIREPQKVAELHILDSVALVPHLPQGVSVLDVGTGGGFPGIPLAIGREDLRLVLVDRTEKKVTFLKAACARLGLAGRVVALHRRLDGHPEEEGIDTASVVVSRAFAPPFEWFSLARHYLAEGGMAVAMLGAELPNLGQLAAALESPSESFQLITYRLPSGADRALLFWRP